MATISRGLELIVFSAAEIPLSPVVDFESRNAATAVLASGSGEAHVHVADIDAGGVIGPHVAGFGQIFLCWEGSGWVAGADGVQIPLARGQVAYFARGELHSKGSEHGLRAVLVQVRDLDIGARTA